MKIMVNTKTKKQEKAVKDLLTKLDLDYSVVEEEAAEYKTAPKKPLTKKDKEILSGISEAVKEMNLVKAGKMKARDARDVINEL